MASFYLSRCNHSIAAVSSSGTDASDSGPGPKRHRRQGRRALWDRSYDCCGVVLTASSSSISLSPLPVSRACAISKRRFSSMALGSAPANCTETCLEVELRTTPVISKDDENSTFAIWKSAVTCTWACPCSDGASWTTAASPELETGCKAVNSNEGEAMASGCCRWCGDLISRTVPRPESVG